ncbi:hypothetical protein [Sphingobacterium multivorum]|uniref:hypothetical protein n=1 Tax=Sphingobacterium multivorum TaxID=28454 RepID=UPI0028A92C24|nr:hypothetical protein [Sphingobacterium multivorum]
MYRKKDDLPLLINSLSIGEKRHFHNFFKRVQGLNGEALFLQLYSMQETGKSQIPKSFADSSERALVSAKRLLYANILKSLRSLHDNSSVDITLQNMLVDIELLFGHNLPDQASLILNKAYNLAADFEKFGHLLQILEWEKRLNITLDEVSRPTSEIIEEERKVLGQYTQLKGLEGLYCEVMLLKRKHGYIKGDLKEQLTAQILFSDQLPAENSCLSAKALYYRNSVLSVFYWMAIEPLKAFEHSKKLMLGKDHSILPDDYLLGLLQHITSAICLGLFDETVYGIRAAETYFNDHDLRQSAKLKSLLFVYRSTYEIKAYIFKGQERKLRKAIYWVEKELVLHENILPADHLQIVKGNLMNAHMALGSSKQADRLWNSLMQLSPKIVRKDILSDLYMFRVFDLMQSGSYEDLISASFKAIRFYEKEDHGGTQYVLERAIMVLLRRKVAIGSKVFTITIIQEIKRMIHDFIIANTGSIRFQEHYSRYVIWCDAIIHSEPFYKAAERWYSGFFTRLPRAF